MIQSHPYSPGYLQFSRSCTGQRQTAMLLPEMFLQPLQTIIWGTPFVQKNIQHCVFSKSIQVENQDHFI